MKTLGILGAQGKMGKLVTELAKKEFASRFKITAKIDRGDSLSPLYDCDLVIDFSSPEALNAYLDDAQKLKKPPALLTGSTGLKDSHWTALKLYAKKAPTLHSANFSTSVLILQKVLKQVGPLLLRLGYHAAVIETHHTQKKDAPSGTAKMLADAMGFQTKDPAPLQVHSIRAGSVVGDHEVHFYGPSDQLLFKHTAQDRALFARGALEVADWLLSKNKKISPQRRLFDIEEFLDER